jgi:hypothetical protein
MGIAGSVIVEMSLLKGMSALITAMAGGLQAVFIFILIFMLFKPVLILKPVFIMLVSAAIRIAIHAFMDCAAVFLQEQRGIFQQISLQAGHELQHNHLLSG